MKKKSKLSLEKFPQKNFQVYVGYLQIYTVEFTFTFTASMHAQKKY